MATNRDLRTRERIREHYQIEKGLADRLREAEAEERRRSYATVYDELFRRVPDHPQLALKMDAQTRRRSVLNRLRLLSRYLSSDSTYLEIGPGDCSLAIEVARRVRRVYAVDVSKEITAGIVLPRNMEIFLSDACSIPVAESSINVACSDQLMEHLHPDDALEQLRNIYGALVQNGIYLCITPNRLSGPHDISRDFDEVATGFHLKEYTAGELAEIFKGVGFRKLRVMVGARSFHVTCPLVFIKAIEACLARLPRRLEKALARGLPLRLILGVKLVGIK